jgi:hypothetical protein
MSYVVWANHRVIATHDVEREAFATGPGGTLVVQEGAEFTTYPDGAWHVVTDKASADEGRVCGHRLPGPGGPTPAAAAAAVAACPRCSPRRR